MTGPGTNTMEKRSVTFSGEVQGVGFRYTACRLAAHYQVRGTVQNMHDGSVECILEGETAELDAFVAELSEEMSDYVRDVAQRVELYTGRLPPFRVKF